ncbi:MAG: EVE domain-containing protein [Alphaproteobacteria bacterium]|nr:EVE domain-containing protein [Alphaproteobacteria bacterium]
MAYWIIKSEPETWSWGDQTTHKTTHWDGVRNYQAANNLKAMRLGDLCFFYHSGAERCIMGIVRVTKEAHLDPTDETGRFVMVDVDYVESLKNPVPLSLIKSFPTLAHLALVKQSRLSVMPVDAVAWKTLLLLGGQHD